jgi:hypothetical protein
MSPSHSDLLDVARRPLGSCSGPQRTTAHRRLLITCDEQPSVYKHPPYWSPNQTEPTDLLLPHLCLRGVFAQSRLWQTDAKTCDPVLVRDGGQTDLLPRANNVCTVWCELQSISKRVWRGPRGIGGGPGSGCPDTGSPQTRKPPELSQTAPMMRRSCPCPRELSASVARSRHLGFS